MPTQSLQPKSYQRKRVTSEVAKGSLAGAVIVGWAAIVKLGWGWGIVTGLVAGLCFVAIGPWPKKLPQQAEFSGRMLIIKYAKKSVSINLDEVDALLYYGEGTARTGRSWYYGVELKDGSTQELFTRGTMQNEDDLLATISAITDIPLPEVRNKWTKWGELPR